MKYELKECVYVCKHFAHISYLTMMMSENIHVKLKIEDGNY